jgi:transposase-like protein
MAKSRKQIHQMTVAQWEAAFPDENACCAYLVGHRWPEGVFCPRCGAEVRHPVATMPFKWQCYACAPNSGYRFSHLTGTIFENTNKPLRDWFRVIHLMLTSKKSISALQIQRMLGFGSYETAHYMCHRIRAGLANKNFQKLTGVVEVDETFVGGKARNRHWDKRGGGPRGGTGGVGLGKAIIAGAIRRKGGVVARVIENVHARGQYVVGAVHTQTIEGFWSLVKRGIMESFHKVTQKYLPLYVAEVQFRYNNRKNADIFGEAIRGC